MLKNISQIQWQLHREVCSSIPQTEQYQYEWNGKVGWREMGGINEFNLITMRQIQDT